MRHVPRLGAGAMRGTLIDLLTVDELAAILRMNPKSVYRYVAERKVPGVVRIGRTMRFNREVVLRWLAGQTDNRARGK